MERSFFIIEHPTRGTLRDWEDDKPSFSWSGARNDPDRAKQYTNLNMAIRDHDRLMQLGNKNLKQCLIRRSPEYRYYCRECGGWIDTRFGHEFGHYPGCPMSGAE